MAQSSNQEIGTSDLLHFVAQHLFNCLTRASFFQEVPNQLTARTGPVITLEHCTAEVGKGGVLRVLQHACGELQYFSRPGRMQG